MAALEDLLKHFSREKDDIFITGANLHIVNGLDATTTTYMATLSAVQPNPVIKTFYGRLRPAGKPEKAARCAAARKLLHIAWAVVKKDQAFDPHHARG
jgi:hypothetical protein